MQIPRNAKPFSWLHSLYYTSQFDWSAYWIVNGEKHICGWGCWWLVITVRLTTLAVIFGLITLAATSGLLIKAASYLPPDPPATPAAIERPATPSKLPATRYANLP